MNYQKLKKYQPEVVRLLKNSHDKNRLVHTYLFHGTKGSLKKEAAYFLASLILCHEAGDCGKCQICKTTLKGNNPNIFHISPIGDTIKKEQILELEHEFSLTSDEKRIFIIEHIDKATLASANSLLKFLEEANENCYGILLTENINHVLLTIKSRCQVVVFKPLNRKILYKQLVEKNITKEIASVMSILTKDFDEANELLADDIVLQSIELAKDLSKAIEDESLDIIGVFAEKGKFLLSEPKKYHHYFLDILITLQNDKIKKMIGKIDDIIFKEMMENNQLMLPQDVQINILERIMAMKSNLNYNINIDLAYIKMLIEIARC